jgi:hypothetical protein
MTRAEKRADWRKDGTGIHSCNYAENSNSYGKSVYCE